MCVCVYIYLEDLYFLKNDGIFIKLTNFGVADGMPF